MKRRAFLQWFGMAPAAMIPAKAAADAINATLTKIQEAAPEPEAVPIMTSERQTVECWCSVSNWPAGPHPDFWHGDAKNGRIR